MAYPKRHTEGDRIAGLLVELTGTLAECLASPPVIPGNDPVTLTGAVIDTATAIRAATEQQQHSIAHLIAAIDRATDKIVKAVDRTSGAGTDFGD